LLRGKGLREGAQLGCSPRASARGNPQESARATRLGCSRRELSVAAAGAAAVALAQARGEFEGEGKPAGACGGLVGLCAGFSAKRGMGHDVPREKKETFLRGRGKEHR
jgi:hypothetical protein